MRRKNSMFQAGIICAMFCLPLTTSYSFHLPSLYLLSADKKIKQDEQISSKVDCQNAKYLLFSCKAKSGSTLSLCYNPQSRNFLFSRINKNIEKQFPLHDLVKITFPATGGPSALVKGATAHGAVYFTIDQSWAEPGPSSVITDFNGKKTGDLCIKKSVITPDIEINLSEQYFENIFTISRTGLIPELKLGTRQDGPTAGQILYDNWPKIHK